MNHALVALLSLVSIPAFAGPDADIGLDCKVEVIRYYRNAAGNPRSPGSSIDMESKSVKVAPSAVLKETALFEPQTVTMSDGLQFVFKPVYFTNKSTLLKDQPELIVESRLQRIEAGGKITLVGFDRKTSSQIGSQAQLKDREAGKYRARTLMMNLELEKAEAEWALANPNGTELGFSKAIELGLIQDGYVQTATVDCAVYRFDAVSQK